MTKKERQNDMDQVATKKWFHHIFPDGITFAMQVAILIFLFNQSNSINSRIDQVNARTDQVNSRLDQLYQMFIDLLKEEKK
jgi:hypothetical protein